MSATHASFFKSSTRASLVYRSRLRACALENGGARVSRRVPRFGGPSRHRLSCWKSLFALFVRARRRRSSFLCRPSDAEPLTPRHLPERARASGRPSESVETVSTRSREGARLSRSRTPFIDRDPSPRPSRSVRRNPPTPTPFGPRRPFAPGISDALARRIPGPRPRSSHRRSPMAFLEPDVACRLLQNDATREHDREPPVLLRVPASPREETALRSTGDPREDRPRPSDSGQRSRASRLVPTQPRSGTVRRRARALEDGAPSQLLGPAEAPLPALTRDG